MRAVNSRYIALMGRHIREIGKLSSSDVHRLIQMRRMNMNIERIKGEIAKALEANIADIEKAFNATAESDLRFAAEIFASDHTPTVKGNKPLERILKAQLRITSQEMANLSRTTLLSDGYRNAVDAAVSAVQSGVMDYNTAIRQALKQVATEGLRVQYPNSDITRRLDSAIRMNVLDGIRAINRDVMEQVGKEFKSDGIELSAHALCAEDHLPHQGTQMSNKEFSRLQNRLDRPFGMWNCKHFWWPILLGISQPAHTDDELREYAENSNEPITIDGTTKTRYQWTQEQRRIETAIRHQKDIANLYKETGDTVGRREAQATINALRDRYTKISEAAGLREQPERAAVSGFRAVKTADQLKKRTEYGTMKTYTAMLSERKLIQKSSTTRSLPRVGEPDSIADFLNESGNTVLQRRVYDYTGRASVDFDTSDHKMPKDHPTGAHKHVFDYSKKNPHGKWMPLTPDELRWNYDIIREGVNYFEQK